MRVFIENVGFDANDPVRLGRFWAAALGAEPATEETDLFEARLQLGDELYLDLCFQLDPGPPATTPRLHLDLLGGPEQDSLVERLLDLSASRLDIGQVNVPWVVLADPEGNATCVMEERAAYVDTGPIAALPMHSSDPQRDGAFWSELSGWRHGPGVAEVSLRHHSGHGPLLEFCPETRPKQGKNRTHLDLRREADDPGLDEILARVRDLGGATLDHDWGELPWVV
ncbi:VOC family protein [Microlunatus sp. Y2014]|uniref:VOC family protein n=1 Tax=Microlunatus sp. Y2014 TaxID=3418488 RepID=UPI003DA711FA